MRLKADWIAHLHAIRKQELELVFSRFPPKAFARGLELGAGDGYQSHMLEMYVNRLISTDYYRPPLDDTDSGSVIYRACDAEKVGDTFGSAEFDLVYSSNLMEHVPDPQAALRGAHKVLKDDGITIHIMPTPLWKFFHLMLHVPNVLLTLEEVTSKRSRNQTVATRQEGDTIGEPRQLNPKTEKRERSILSRLMIPDPHGVSETNFSEFAAFSKRRWSREFERAGFEILALLKGPLASGYGFGFDRLRNGLRSLGLTSEYVYVAKKAGRPSRFEEYFQPAEK